MVVVISERHVFTDIILVRKGLLEETDAVVVTEPHATPEIILAGIGLLQEEKAVVVSEWHTTLDKILAEMLIGRGSDIGGIRAARLHGYNSYGNKLIGGGR